MSRRAKTPPPLAYPVRLNRYIAHCGLCGRREADLLIANGKISINGHLVSEMGIRIHASDEVYHEKKRITPQRHVYFLLNKPRGYLTTTKDEKNRPTVMDLMKEVVAHGIFPVGRLDRNTTGLLLFTNDGQFMQRLTHPSYEVAKVYEVTLVRALTQTDLSKIRQGIRLEDGIIKPDKVYITDTDGYVIGLQIHSGKNRVVRRMFEALGHAVDKLDRVTYGFLTKKNIGRGSWRHLSPKEVHFLQHAST